MPNQPDQPDIEQPAPGRLNVTIRSTVPATDSGVLVLARIDAPQAGLNAAYLLLDPDNNAIALMAACGCMATVSLSRLIVDLADMVKQSHGQAHDSAPSAADDAYHATTAVH